jgi:hypothetical protein
MVLYAELAACASRIEEPILVSVRRHDTLVSQLYISSGLWQWMCEKASPVD